MCVTAGSKTGKLSKCAWYSSHQGAGEEERGVPAPSAPSVATPVILIYGALQSEQHHKVGINRRYVIFHMAFMIQHA